MKFYSLITGATGGLGRAFVFECANRGDNLILTGTNQTKLEEIVNEVIARKGHYVMLKYEPVRYIKGAFRKIMKKLAH